MNFFEKLKQLLYYLGHNKTLLVVGMLFIFIFLVNEDIFMNRINKNISNEHIRLKKIALELKKLKKQSASLNIEKKRLFNVQRSALALKNKLKEEEKMLPRTFKISELIRQISESTPKTNFIIETVVFGKPVFKKKFSELPLEISLISGFNKALIFIKNINSLKRIFLINTIHISPDKKFFPNVKIVVKGKVFALNLLKYYH